MPDSQRLVLIFVALDFWHRFDCLDISWFSSSSLPSCFTFHSIRWVHFEKTYKSLKIFGIRVPNIFKSTRNKMQNHIPYFKHSSSSMITKILWLIMAFLSCKIKSLGLAMSWPNFLYCFRHASLKQIWQNYLLEIWSLKLQSRICISFW